MEVTQLIKSCMGKGFEGFFKSLFWLRDGKKGRELGVL